MPDSTPYSLVKLLDKRAIYASCHADGVLHVDAPGHDPEGEIRLRNLLSFAVEKILRLEALTRAELDACKQALDWYAEFEQAGGISLDAPRALLDAWNRPKDLPDHTAALHLGREIVVGSLAEDAEQRVAQRTAGNQLLAQRLQERGHWGTEVVAAEIHAACGLAEVNARKAPWRLQRGELEEAVAGLDEAIDALRGVRERIVG